MNKNIKFEKYNLTKNKDGSINKKDWIKSVSELDQVAVAKYIGSLLYGEQAKVMLVYKNGNVREVSGDSKEVMIEVISIINLKKNEIKKNKFKELFIDRWNKAKPYSPKDFIKEDNLLSDHLKFKGISATQFAENVNQTKQSIYNQLSGERSISRDTAIKYGKSLGVDPVDLLFTKRTTAVWGKVNTLQQVNLDESYARGRIYPLYEDETVIVPRDIYTQNIRAIKIDARGSMYHNQVAFYYKDNASDLEINNKLCIVGVEVEGFFDEILTYYYFGLYENLRGKNNLINPDPFAEGEDKYILKNFNLKFISPVISTMDPKSIIDATAKQTYIPKSELSISVAEAEKKLADLGFSYEMKIKELNKQKESDRIKARKILDEYQNNTRKVENDIYALKKEMNDYIKNTFYKYSKDEKPEIGSYTKKYFDEYLEKQDEIFNFKSEKKRA